MALSYPLAAARLRLFPFSHYHTMYSVRHRTILSVNGLPAGLLTLKTVLRARSEGPLPVRIQALQSKAWMWAAPPRFPSFPTAKPPPRPYSHGRKGGCCIFSVILFMRCGASSPLHLRSSHPGESEGPHRLRWALHPRTCNPCREELHSGEYRQGIRLQVRRS